MDNSFTRKLNLFPIRLDSNDQSNAKQSKLFGAEKSDIGITRFTNDLFLPKDGYSLLQTPTESIPTVHPNVGSIISGQNSWSQAFLANYPPDKSYLGTISTLGNSEGSTVPLRNLSALKSHELPLTPIAGAKAGNNLFEVYTENATQPFLRANQNLESYRKGDSAPLRKSDRREQKVDFIGELLGFVVALGIVLLVFAIVADALIGVINDALALMTAFATSNIIGIVITGVVINLFTDGLKHLLKLWNQGKS